MANYTKSEILKNIPRHLKTQPGAPKTHLAYITDDEAKMLQKKKPGTPHGTRFGIPSYDFMSETGGWVSSGDAVDVGGSQPSTNTQSNLGSGLPGGSNITGTTSGTPNPHTGTGFSGGPTLASGAPNPGFTPPPTVDTSGGDGGDGVGTGGDGSGLGVTDTGSGSSGSGAAGSGMTGTELAALANSITGSNILEGGIGNLLELSRDTLSLSDRKMMENLGNLETENVSSNFPDLRTFNLGNLEPENVSSNYFDLNKFNLGNDDNTIQKTPDKIQEPYFKVGQPKNIKQKVEDWWDDARTVGAPEKPLGQLVIDPDPRKGKISGEWTKDTPIGTVGVTGGYDTDLGANAGFKLTTDTDILRDLLPEWIPLAQGGPVGLMSLPQGYENGGEVIEGTDTMEELTPFGGTRERVIDQVEAFDNAPHHIEEPMIGMWGEKVPLSIARRVQGYMEGLDPVKRNLIQEMMQMFRMKKMQEKQQDQQQEGLYFGPQPKEYAI